MACGVAIPTRSTEWPDASSATAAFRSAAASEVYAGFWRRFAAFWIDFFITVASMSVVVALVRQIKQPLQPLLMLLLFVIVLLYHVTLESSSLQATVGKMALGIKVTDERGQRLSVGRSLGRTLAKFISRITLYVGYLIVATTERRQGLHDMIANTLVVRRTVPPAEIATAGPAKKIPGVVVFLVAGGFAFFMLAYVGILAAIAIPAYQSYLIRSQVTEGLRLADTYRDAVTEALAGGRSADSITSDSLRLRKPESARYVSDIEVEAGIVVIEYGHQANQKIAGKTLLLVPGLTSEGRIVWICGTSTPPPGVQLPRENLAQYNSVPSSFLPSSCRT